MTEIDDTSETILAVLAGLGGEADAGELKQTIDNQLPQGDEIDYSSIHYRCSPERDGVLHEEGFVEPAGTAPRSGGTRDATVYSLADNALAEVKRRDDIDIHDSRNAEEAIEALNRVEETVANFDARLAELEDRINSLEDEADSYGQAINRLERAKLETDDLRDALNGWKQSIDHAVATADAVEELAEDNKTDINGLSEDVERMEAERLPQVEEKAREAYQNSKDNLGYIQQIWGTLNIKDYLEEDTTLKNWLKENYRQKRF